MRTFGTIVLGFFFMLCFSGCFIVHAVGGYPLDAEAVTDTMRKTDMYGMVMEGLDLALVDSMEDTRHPEMAKDIGSGLKDTLEESMSEEWFYETFETSYGGFVSYLEGAEDGGEIDLTDQRESVAEYLEEVAEKYGKADPNAKKDMEKTMDVFPEKTTLAELLEESGSLDDDALEDMRGTIANIKTIRIIFAVLCLVLLGLIALVAKSSTKRLLISVGAVLLVSSLFYLAGASGIGTALWSSVEADLERPDENDEVDKFASEMMTKLARTALEDAFSRSNLPVGGLAGLSVLLIGAGFVFGKKKDPPIQPGGMPGSPFAPPGHDHPGQQQPHLPPQHPYAPPQNNPPH